MTINVIRSQHQLGDFLLGPHFDKLRLDSRSPPLQNKMKNNMNTLRNEKLLKSFISLDISTGTSTLAIKEEVTNTNYVKNKNSAKKERKKDQVDNENFQMKNRRISRSPKFKTSKNPKQKGTTEKEQIKVIAMDLEEVTDEEKKKSVDLQKEIEKEQEYQNQMNMIYNCPIILSNTPMTLSIKRNITIIRNSSSIHKSSIRTLQCISSLHLNLVLKVNWFIFNQLIAPVIP